MLDQMIESKSHGKENSRRGGLLMATFALMGTVLSGGWTYSLYAKNVALGAGDIDMANLVAPVAIPEEAPAPAPPPAVKPNAPASNSKQVTLTQIVDEVRPTDNPPKDTAGQAGVINARQFGVENVRIGRSNSIPENAVSGRTDGAVSNNTCAFCNNNNDGKNTDADKDDAPVVKPTPKATPQIPKNPVSLGVINGKATNLVKPAYPAAARAIRASGAVNVQVTIDERGNVVSAAAVSGHPLLRAAAAEAARQSKFTPTMLSNIPVKVTGVIVYNFAL